MRVIVCLAALTATLGAAPLARAQPVTRPDPCSITIPRAPAEVRAEIERAVQAGPRCTSSLEVRAVPSDGGFYVSARDDHGTVRDGIAPDAARAGELVASWVADDAAAQGAVGPTAPGTPTEPPEYGEPADPGEQLAPVTAHDERTQLAPPEIAPPAGTLIVRAGPAEPRGVNHLMLGGLSGSGAHRWGARAELDLLAMQRFSLGVAGALYTTGELVDQRLGVDGSATVYLAHTLTLGGWRLRGSLGTGVAITSSPAMTATTDRTTRTVHALLEAGLLLERELGARFSIAGGPIVSVTLAGSSASTAMTDHRDVATSLYLGLVRRF